jgi:hypothetical protein
MMEFNTEDSTMQHVLGHILLELQVFLRAETVRIECEIPEEAFYDVVQRTIADYSAEIIVVRDDGDVDKGLKEMESFTIKFAWIGNSEVVLKKGGPATAVPSLPSRDFTPGNFLE